MDFVAHLGNYEDAATHASLHYVAMVTEEAIDIPKKVIKMAVKFKQKMQCSAFLNLRLVSPPFSVYPWTVAASTITVC